MASVTQIKVVTKVTGDIYGDISRSVTSVGARLNSKGYGVYPRIDSATNKVTWEIKRAGQPFEDDKAISDLQAAISAVGLRVGNIATWVVQAVAYVATAPYTSGKAVVAVPGAVADAVAAAKARFDDCIAKGGTAVTCAGPSAGIPNWVWWVGGALAGLYVLNSLTQAKRAFLGGTPREAYVSQTYGRVRVRKTNTGHYYTLDGGQSWHGPYTTKSKAFSAGRAETVRINK